MQFFQFSEIEKNLFFSLTSVDEIITINFFQFKACPHFDLEEVIMTLRKRRLVPGGFWSVALSRVEPNVLSDTPTSTSSMPPPAPIHPQSINYLRVSDQLICQVVF